jgi:hypothetical protein
VKAKVKKLIAIMGRSGKMPPLPLIEQAASNGPPPLKCVVGGALPTFHG